MRFFWSDTEIDVTSSCRTIYRFIGGGFAGTLMTGLKL